MAQGMMSLGGIHACTWGNLGGGRWGCCNGGLSQGTSGGLNRQLSLWKSCGGDTFTGSLQRDACEDVRLGEAWYSLYWSWG